MPRTWFGEWMQQKPLIGMLHLGPLPGAPRAGRAGYRERLDAVIAHAVADAKALAAGGCHGLMLENFGDTPFFPGRVPVAVAAAMTAVASEVQRVAKLPLGINVLRNDGLSALAVAAATRASFIRVNVLSGARVTDQGVIQGIAHDLLRERALLGADEIAILADVDVKHSAPLAARPISDEVGDAIARGMADAVIVSGSGTGAAVDLNKLAEVKKAAGSTPVLIGSGVTTASLEALAGAGADGFIVGTSLKEHSVSTNPVDVARVRAMVDAHRIVRATD